MITMKWIDIGESEDLKDAREIRKKVFTEEFEIPEEIEIDGTDILAKHLILYLDDKPVATGRKMYLNGQCILSRIAVLKNCRKQNFGKILMDELISECKNSGDKTIIVHAHNTATGFYEKLGFKSFSDVYIEDDIPQINMKLEL